MAKKYNVEIRFVQTGLAKVSQGFNQLAERANLADRAVGLLKKALIAVGITSITRDYIRLSDTFQTIQNRMKLVTDSERSRIAITRELADIAASTYASLEATGELYARLALNTRGLGIAQKDVLQITKSLNQAVILSGAGVREASNGLIQLSQGLASNSLRGDELRAVLEQLPYVADVIAKKLGVTRGALRILAFDGAIDAKTVVDAFTDAADEINEQFAKIRPTIGQAFQALQSRLVQMVGEFNSATGSSNALADTIVRIAEGIVPLTDYLIVFAENVQLTWRAVDDSAKAMFKTLGFEGKNLIEDVLHFFAQGIDFIPRLLTGVYTLTMRVFKELKKDIPIALKAIYNVIVELVAEMLSMLYNTLFTGAGSPIGWVNMLLEKMDLPRLSKVHFELDFAKFDLNTAENVARMVNMGVNLASAFKDGFSEGFDEAYKGVESGLENLKKRAQERADERARTGRNFGELPEGVEGETEMDRRLARLAEEVKSQQTLKVLGRERTIIAAQEAASENLRRKFTQNKIEAQTEEQKILMERMDILVRTTAEEEILHGLRQQAADMTDDMEDQLRLLKMTVDEREIEAELLPIINAAKKAGADQDERIVELIANMRRKRVELRAEQEQEQIINEIFGNRERILRRIQALQAMRSQEQDFGRARALRIAEIDAERESRKGDLSFMAGLQNGLGELEKKVIDVAGGVENALVNAFNSAEDALVEFVQTGEFNFSKLVDSILADLTRLLARQAIMGLFSMLSSGGAAGGAGGGLFSLFGLSGARADGGPVGANQSYLVGENGPEIFTPNQSGNIIPNGAPVAAPPVNVSVVNVLDPSMVTQALNDPSSEQIIVNIISKNRSAISRQLGVGS